MNLLITLALVVGVVRVRVMDLVYSFYRRHWSRDAI